MESFVDELLEFDIIGQQFDEGVGEVTEERAPALAGGERMLDIELKVCIDFVSAIGIIFPCRLHGSSS